MMEERKKKEIEKQILKVLKAERPLIGIEILDYNLEKRQNGQLRAFSKQKKFIFSI